jgi:hypothetical protein
MANDYKYSQNTYPLIADELSHEGAFKRFTHFPTPKEVLDYAMLGLPRYMPLNREPITEAMVEPFLSSAVTEIEMETGADISEVTHFHIEDTLPDQLTANWTGIRLMRWPATEITSMSFKYPHAATTSVYQRYEIPRQWVMLRKNRINLIAGIGSVSVITNSSALAPVGGLFSFISVNGFRPGAIEVIYKSGFSHDKLPSSVADLIKTWAAHRFLSEIIPVLFPQNSTTVTIDSVSQSVSLNIFQALQARLTSLEQKKKELQAALIKSFGKTIKYAFIGS